MKEKEFEEEYKRIKIKNDINLLNDMIELYSKKYKNPPKIETIYNEIHDCFNYSEEEIKTIIQQAKKLRNEQNQ